MQVGRGIPVKQAQPWRVGDSDLVHAVGQPAGNMRQRLVLQYPAFVFARARMPVTVKPRPVFVLVLLELLYVLHRTLKARFGCFQRPQLIDV